MKIALCLSGRPSYLKKGYESLYDKILSKYNVDCFVHTWWDPGQENTTAYFAPNLSYGRKYIWEPDTLEFIQKKYNPKIFLNEPQLIFKPYSEVNYGMGSSHHIHSFMYSLYYSNQLKKFYEEKNSFKYDLVIRSRFDVILEKFNICLNEIDSNYVYSGSATPDPNIKKIIKSDFSFGSSKCMDVYSSIFPNFDYCFKNIDKLGGIFVPENLISFILDKNNIPKKFIDEYVIDKLILDKE
jgi:hypothetical protein